MVEVDLRLILRLRLLLILSNLKVICCFFGQKIGYFENWGQVEIVVKQVSFLMIPSILIFEFDLILGSFLLFGALIGYFCGRGWVQKQFLGLPI